MSTCPKCGSNVPDGAKFCPECSYNLTEQNDGANNATQAEFHAQPAYNPQQPNNSVPPQGYDSYQAPPQQPGYTPYQPSPNGGGIQTNPTVLLVWSIINLICCCLPLGIVGLVFTLTAKNEFTPEGQEKNLKNAFVCNLIGTIVGLIVEVIYFFAIFLTAF